MTKVGALAAKKHLAATGDRGDLVSLTVSHTFSVSTLDYLRMRFFGIGRDPNLPPLTGPVTAYVVTYRTLDARGKPTVASGLLMVPATKTKTAVPLVSYQHGTLVGRDSTPSRDPDLAESKLCAAVFAGAGKLIAMADY